MATPDSYLKDTAMGSGGSGGLHGTIVNAHHCRLFNI